jgi:hypothetical protein
MFNGILIMVVYNWKQIISITSNDYDINFNNKDVFINSFIYYY